MYRKEFKYVLWNEFIRAELRTRHYVSGSELGSDKMTLWTSVAWGIQVQRGIHTNETWKVFVLSEPTVGLD